MQGSDGSFFVLGGGPSEQLLAKLSATGTLDTSFGNGGVVRGELLGAGRVYPLQVAVQSSGKIAILGQLYDWMAPESSKLVVARFTASGLADGIKSDGDPSLAETDADIRALQSDGRFLVVRFTDNEIQPSLARYQGSGELSAAGCSGSRNCITASSKDDEGGGGPFSLFASAGLLVLAFARSRRFRRE